MFGIDLSPTPVADYIESLGYKQENVNGKKVFKQFDSVEIELNSLFNGVGLKEIINSAVLELKGKDVLDFLHRISTNAIKDLPKEGFERTVLTNEKGRIIDLITVANFGDHQLLICSNSHKEKVIRWIEKYVIMDDVQVTDSNGKYILLGLLGPQADSFITMVCGNIINEIKPGTFKAMRAEGIIFFLAKHHDIKGFYKYFILSDAINAVELIKYMQNNKGPFDFNFIGEDAYNSYRINFGIPSSPNELNDNYNPLESKLSDYVSFTKGCYIGQEVIARLDTYDKVQKHLSAISFEAPLNGAEQLFLFDENKNEAGIVTSTSYSPRSKSYIGLAYIRKDFSGEGTRLIASDKNGTEIPAVVENIPIRKR